MEVILPEQEVQASTLSPELLVIFSAPKTGKTTLVAGLKSNLIIDLEKGSNFVNALKIKAETYQELHEICEEIKKKGKPYRYVTIDTVTAMEDMCIPLALKLYQRTPMGSTYKGDILSLPQGAGYKYLRDAFDVMLNDVRGCAERVILLGHTKDKSIEKGGKEVIARELALTGKISPLTCAKADAIAFLYRQGNKCVLTFETTNELICGARPVHLRNKELIISEQDEATGVTTTYWNRVFID